MNRQLKVAFGLLLGLCVSDVHAEFSRFTTVASGLYRPVFAASPPGDTDRLFIAQKDGVIRILDLNTNSLLPDPFLSIQNIREQAEGGLLGLAFHPNYENNGKFYTYSTLFNDNPSSFFSTHVQEYTVSPTDPNVAQPTPNDILVYEQPAGIHNAGWLGFNPSLAPGQPQYLHISSGDGGDRENAQNTDNLFGSILRIDVDGDDFPSDPDRDYAIPSDNPFVNGPGRDEVWSYGLRNPWRSSFDRETGDLWIGDVGSLEWEEVNFQSADSAGGENYGWDRREGPDPYRGGSSLPGDVEPVYSYPHNDSAAAVIGGYVYRGPDADEQGKYIFGDNPRSFVSSFDPDDPANTVESLSGLPGALPTGSQVYRLLSFGEDAIGNLYAFDAVGRVLLLEPGRIAGDYNGDGLIGDLDYTRWASDYGSTTDPAADGNGDGVVDAADYAYWRDALAKYGAVYGEAPNASAVPEPAGITVVLGGLLACLRRRSSRCGC